MSNEELVALIQAGERDRLAELWAQVEKFIRKTAKTWPHTGAVDLDDLTQSGYLALVSAVETYSPERDCSFVGWLALHLKTAFSEASGCRSKKQLKDPIHQADSLNRPLDDEDGGELADIVADPHGCQGIDEVEDRLWQEQLHTAMETALAALPEAESDTIRRRYYRGQTLARVAQETGRTPYEVQKEERRALSILRKPKVSASLRAFIEERTPYYLHVGANRFNSTGTSAVEEIVFRRAGMERRGVTPA